jgi:hypothetical protein
MAETIKSRQALWRQNTQQKICPEDRGRYDEWEQGFRARQIHMPSFMMEEDSTTRAVLDLLVLTAIMYSAVFTPYNASFGSGVWRINAAFRSFIYIVDVVSHFRTCYTNRDFEVVTATDKIAWMYLRR